MANNKSSRMELDIKAVYTEANASFRYHSTWRHRMFAGYLALLFALSVIFSWLYDREPSLLWLIPLIGFIFALMMWGLEYRNREIVKACRESGEECESKLPEGVGFFKQLKKHEAKLVSHTFILDVLFGGSAVVLLIIAIMLFIKCACGACG